MPKLINKQKLFITQLIALVFIFIGFYFIDFARKSAYETDIWHVVASEAIALIEVEHPEQLIAVKDSSTFLNALNDLEGGKKSSQILNQFLTLLDSAVNNPRLGVKGNVYFSLNSTGSKYSSWSFYIPTEERFYLDYFKQLKSLPNKRFHRQYKGVEVQEFDLSGEILSVAKIRNFIVASTDALWIEEAIRNDGERFYDEYYFETLNQQFHQYNSSNKLIDGVNIWLRPNAIVEWFAGMKDLGKEHPFPDLLSYTFGLRLYDCEEKENEVTVKAHNQLSKDSFLAYVDDYLGSSEDHTFKMMTDDIAFYERWNVRDVEGFIQQSKVFSNTRSSNFISSRQQSFDKKGIQPKLLTNHLKGDFVKATVANVTGNTWNSLFFFEIEDNIALDKDLIDFKRSYEKATKTKAEVIGRSGFSILRIKEGDLTGGMFGINFQAKSSVTYLVKVDNFLVICGDLPTLSKWLNDWLVKRRWVNQKQFNVLIKKLKSTKFKASMVFNSETSWSSIINALSPSYQRYFNRHRQLLLSLNYQVWGYQSNKFEWSGLFSGELREDKERVAELLFSKETGVTLKYPPFVYKDAFGGIEGFALIDKENILEAYNFTGDTVFYQEFDAELSSKPELIWDENQKSSLFVSQNNRVLHLSREAQYYSDYPVNLPDISKVAYLKWLPWHADGSKDFYQNTEGILLAVDTLGNIYGMDPNGNLRGKWKPVNTLQKLCMPPYVFESNAKNYVITLSDEGKLILFDAEGRYMNGFPKLFRKKVSPKIFVVEDATLEGTSITFISKIGELVEVNAKGGVERLEMLGDRASNRRFQLLIDEARNRNYLIMDQRYGHIKIKNSGGQLMFSKKFKEKSLAIGQCFDFGIDAEIVSITFPKEKKTYLYYSNGKPFISSSLENESEIKMIYKSELQQFLLITSVGNKTEIHTVDRRN